MAAVDLRGLFILATLLITRTAVADNQFAFQANFPDFDRDVRGEADFLLADLYPIERPKRASDGMRKYSDEQHPFVGRLPEKIPNVFFVLCLLRIEEARVIDSTEAAALINWLYRRSQEDYPGHQAEREISTSIMHGLLGRAEFSNEERAMLVNLLKRQIRKPEANLVNSDPDNIPTLRAAFLAHTINSTAPTAEETKARLKRLIETLDPPGSTNEERFNNARREAQHERRQSARNVINEQTLIEVAHRMGWVLDTQPDTERVEQAVKDQSAFLLKFLSFMYGRRPTTMEESSREEFIRALDMAEMEPWAVE